MADRHTYSKKELAVYFDRVQLPDSQRIYDVAGISNEDKVEFLHLLQKHHIVKVPWENLVQHYSWHKVVNVKPRHLFKKIVRQPGRGGCVHSFPDLSCYIPSTQGHASRSHR